MTTGKRATAILLMLAVAGAGYARGQRERPVALLEEPPLRYWMPLHATTAQIVRSFGETFFAQELLRRTGVRVEWIHPAGTTDDQIEQAFDLMLASGDMPDIVEYRWADISGGPNSAISNGYILGLNDVLERYAPNLRRFLREHPDYDKMAKTDEGNYYVFPFFRAHPSLVVTSGLVVRKDWLDELGLPIPATLEEWSRALRAFQAQKGAVVPMSARYGNLLNAFYPAVELSYADNGFTVEEGRIRYSLTDPRQRELLTVLHQWFVEGLLDPNFPSLDARAEGVNITSGRSGATYGSGGSGIGVWTAARRGDPRFELAGAPFPRRTRGSRGKTGVRSDVYGGANYGNAAISARSTKVEQAAGFLDYAYGDEGHMLFNFGIEGESYTIVGGAPRYTDCVMASSEGLAVSQAMSWYMRGHNNGPFVQDYRYIEQYYGLPQQRAAQVIWAENDFERYKLPPVTPTPAESAEASRLLSEMNDYAEEMVLKLIMGAEPLSKLGEYIATLETLGAERLISIYQAAYDRYLER